MAAIILPNQLSLNPLVKMIDVYFSIMSWWIGYELAGRGWTGIQTLDCRLRSNLLTVYFSLLGLAATE